MPRRQRNLVRRKGRPGWYFRRKKDGKVTWRALGTDYEEAVRKLQQLKDHVPLPEITVKRAAAMWLQNYVATERREQDRSLAAQRVRDYLVPAMGHLLLERVRRNDLRRYKLHLEGTHLSPQSVVHVLSDARCFFRWCEETELIERAPIPRKLVPRLQERPPDRLSREEVERVTRITEPYGFMCRFLVSTGLRWSEFVRARSSDVQGNVIVVHRTKSTKLRRVPLPATLRGELKDRVGRFSHISTADSLNESVRLRTGIENFHVHRLRHTFACQWIEDGGSLAALQIILGHASIVTTQRYAKLSDDYVQMEAERLAAKVAAKQA